MREARTMTEALAVGTDGKMRCSWATSTDDYIEYHDNEWGKPVRGDEGVFERLCLEGFQAGLSWLTILRKRANFRSAFLGFDPAKVAQFTETDIQALLGDAGIVRHRGKIEATVANARAVVAMLDNHESLSDLVWSYEPTPRNAAPESFSDIAAKTPESIALSKRLKQLGFRFVGPTTMHAAMQAMGIVNDHFAGCHAR